MTIYKSFFQRSCLLLAAGLMAGCSQGVSQNDVNKQRDEAARTSEDAQKKSEKVAYEARKAIVDTEQQRREKVGEARTELQTNPDANAPKLQGKIEEANRQADKKVTDIRQDATDKQRALNENVRDKVDKANETAATFEAQKAQMGYVENHEKTLQEYDSNIVDVKKQRANLAGEARDRFDQRVKYLDEKRSKAETDLKKLKSASPEDWATFRDETDQAFVDLKTAYDQAAHPQS